MYNPLTSGISAMVFCCSAGDMILHKLLSNWTENPAEVMRLVEIRVRDIFGVYSTFFSVTTVVWPPRGRLILISPHPIALIVVPSAVCTSWIGMSEKVMNLDRSGQKCDVAPESIIAPALSSNVAITVAEVNAKLSWGGGADTVLADCFF
jgi:hypothetical protein